MKHKCPKHGSSLHYHVCRHVRHACDSAAPLPALGRQDIDLICRDCLTDEVALLFDGLDGMTRLDDHFFDCYHQLAEKIGYSALCTDCLFEKTGVDRRRRNASGQLY